MHNMCPAVFGENAKKESMVTTREYYAYRLQIQPSVNSILLPSSHLLQQYIVDMYVKLEIAILDFFRYKQDEMRFDLYQGVVDSIKQGKTSRKKV